MTPFSDWMLRAIAMVEEDCPMAWQPLLDAVGDLHLCVEIGDEPAVWVHRDADTLCVRHEVTPSPASQHVSLRSSREVVLSLAKGRQSLLEAIEARSLELLGDVAALLRFDGALQAFLCGAVRSSSFPSLLSAFDSDTHSSTRYR